VAAEAQLAAAGVDDARAAAERALALAREGSHRVCELWAEHSLGQIAARDGARDDVLAERHFRRALAAPRSSGCARSRRTAIWASASSTVAREGAGVARELRRCRGDVREMQIQGDARGEADARLPD